MSDTPKLNYSIGNKFYILGNFDNSISTEIIPFLGKEIENQKSNKDGKISFYINSDGGDADILFLLLFYIEQAKKDIIVETYILSKAFSCGSLLAISGTKGSRYITPLASHLVHWGGASTGMRRTEKDFQRTSQYFLEFKQIVQNLYSKYTDLTAEQIKTLHDQDSAFLFAQECIDFGLADQMSFEMDLGKPSLRII